MRVHAARIASASAGEIGRTPPSPWIGSTMMAAVSASTTLASDAGSAASTNVTPGISGANGAR